MKFLILAIVHLFYTGLEFNTTLSSPIKSLSFSVTTDLFITALTIRTLAIFVFGWTVFNLHQTYIMVYTLAFATILLLNFAINFKSTSIFANFLLLTFGGPCKQELCAVLLHY